jgi:DNA-binding MarR family transcriptional regulator
VKEKALSTWMNTLVRYVRSDHPDLTNRQMALMKMVYTTPGPHTVRGLASELGVSKPVITRAVNTHSATKLLKREVNRNDARSVDILPTEEGAAFLRDFEGMLGKRM